MNKSKDVLFEMKFRAELTKFIHVGVQNGL